MWTIALCSLLLADGPDGLTLPFEKATKLSDTALAVMPRCGRRGLRGLIVADDGTAIFGSDGDVWRMSSDTDTSSAMQVFVRTEGASSPAMTSNQAGFMQQSSPAAGKALARAHLADLVAAKNHDEVVALHPMGPTPQKRVNGLSTMSLKFADPALNRLVMGGNASVFPAYAIADRATDGFLIEFGMLTDNGYQTTDIRTTLNPESLSKKFPPGFVPMLYDSKNDAIVCFTYSESGTPNDIRVKHVANDEVQKLTRQPGRIDSAALLADGTVLVSYTPRFDEDPQPGTVGLFSYAPPYVRGKFCGPYRLTGSSRTGEWITLAHQTLRQSWLVKVK